jgi:hypothetical protein
MPAALPLDPYSSQLPLQLSEVGHETAHADVQYFITNKEKHPKYLHSSDTFQPQAQEKGEHGDLCSLPSTVNCQRPWETQFFFVSQPWTRAHSRPFFVILELL